MITYTTKNRHSDNYRFTITSVMTDEDKIALNLLKGAAKFCGRRIVLKGRLGKNNPNAYKYNKFSGRYRNIGYHSHQTIRKEDAAFFDVYSYAK